MNEKKVYLNIYDLTQMNNCLWSCGLGLYHTTIEIGNKEYNFSANYGINYKTLKNCKLNLRDKIYYGSIYKSEREISHIINGLKYDYNKSRYHPTNNNCNHFSNELLETLFYKSLPNYINRLTDSCMCLGTLIPKSYYLIENCFNERSSDKLIFSDRKESGDKKKLSLEDELYGFELV